MTQLHWRNYADLVRDTMKLAPMLADVDAIVGIPRSGMFPAAILATALHKPLGMIGEVDPTSEPVYPVILFASGARLKDGPPRRLSVAVVDDSVLVGSAMNKAHNSFEDHESLHVVRACVYCHPASTDKVDAYAVALPSPRVFEWNLFGSELSKHSILDIDGVLCPDPPVPEDDWAAYLDYLVSAPLLHKPLFKVAGLVTNRLEKTRDVTEAWLADHGIEYGTLTMAPFESAQARRRMSTPADLKSAWYAGFIESHPTPGILIESHDHIASQVARNVRRPVVSLQSMRCFE